MEAPKFYSTNANILFYFINCKCCELFISKQLYCYGCSIVLIVLNENNYLIQFTLETFLEGTEKNE